MWTKPERPPSTKELLSIVAAELGNARSAGYGKSTVKDLLTAIHHKVSALEQRQRYKPVEDTIEKTTATVVLGMLCVFLVWSLGSKPPDSGILKTYSLEITAGGLVAGALAILVSLERMVLLQTLMKSMLVRLVFGFVFALIVAISTSQANTALNQALGVDASNAPIARAMLTAILVIKSGWIVAVALGVTALLHALLLIKSIMKIAKGEDSATDISWSSVFFIISSIVLGWSYTSLTSQGFTDEVLPVKAYILAEKFDFNDKALCLTNGSNEPEVPAKYLFIGASQETVLIGPKLTPNELTASFFTQSDVGLRLDDIKTAQRPCT